MSVTPQLDLRDAPAPPVLCGAGPVPGVEMFMLIQAEGQCLANRRGAGDRVPRLPVSGKHRHAHVLPVFFLEGE